MKTELVQTLTSTFEAHAQQTEGGIEYWLARDLQHLLGYDEWRNFTAVIIKAKTACEVSGHSVRDHFVDVKKMIQIPKSAEKESRVMPSCLGCETKGEVVLVSRLRAAVERLNPALPLGAIPAACIGAP